MTTVVWYNSAEAGAPTLNNAPGSLDAVLNACLVTGFRVLTLDSLTVSAGVATATYAAGHGYSDKRVLELAGAATAAINGRKLITVTGASTFTFPAPGVADSPSVGGSIQAKRASLGWERPLSSGNVSMYQRTDPAATGMKLRVDDSGSGAASAISARWRMVEAYTDLNTFTGASPGASVYGGAGVYIPKGANTTTAKAWVLIGDARGFYLYTDTSGYPASSYSGTLQGAWGFGDLEPYRSGDAYACFVAGADAADSVAADAVGRTYPMGVSPASENVRLARPFNGIGASVRLGMYGSGDRRLGGSGPPYPSPVDNGLTIGGPVLASEASGPFGNPIRGHFRGMGDPLATVPAGSLHLIVLENLLGSDRHWLLVGFNHQGSYGHAAFDITGPW